MKVTCTVKLVSSAKRVHWRLTHRQRTVAHGIFRVRHGRVELPVSRLASLHHGRYVLRFGDRPPAAPRYLDLEIPHRFMLQIRTRAGTWLEEAVSTAERTHRLEDGSYTVGTGGVGIMFRCIEGTADGFVHVDGGGRRFDYRLLPIKPDGTIELPEGGTLYP